MTPPRVLVGTVLNQTRLHAFQRWESGLRNQRTELRWDLLLAIPSPLAGAHLHRWSRSQPFGPRHRVRLRAPASEDEAANQVPGRFKAWASYEALLLLDLDVWMPAHAMQSLYEAHAPWATASGHPHPPSAPLACALLTREAIERSDVTPTYVPGVWWERIEAPAELADEPRARLAGGSF